jgi:peptidoglycan hydrolase CwlO-like protein
VTRLEAQEKRLDEIKAQVQKMQSEVQAIDKAIEAKLSALG